MKSMFSPWCIAVLGMLLVLTLVCSTAVAQQDGPRPKADQDRMEGGRGQGGMRGMARMMGQPVMLINQGYLYILTGNVLYMLDAETLEQINAVHLMPPPPPEGMVVPMPPRAL